MKLSKNLTTVTPFSKSLALFLFVLLPVVGFCLGRYYEKGMNSQTDSSNRYSATSSSDAQIVVQLATSKVKNAYPDKKIGVSEQDLKIDGDWAHGTAGVKEGGPGIILFVAHKENGQWNVVLETEPEYLPLLQQLPDTIMSKAGKDVYKTW